MVVIKRQGPNFSGDLGKDKAKYEKAKDNKETLFEKLLPIEQEMFDRTGFNRFSLPPPGVHETKIPDDDNVQVEVVINTHRKTKTPAYKGVTESMTNYLDGVVFWLSQVDRLAGVRREKNIPYIRVNIVKNYYDIIVAGALEPSLRRTIDCLLRDPIAKEKTLSQLVVEDIDRTGLIQDDLIFYVRSWRIINDEEKLIDAYEKGVKEQVPKGVKKKIVQVSSTKGYSIERSKKTKADYTKAVKTIVTVPVVTHAHYVGEEIPIVGELNRLDDPSFGFEEKVKMFPYYDLIYPKVGKKRILYISIPSIYQRIQTLLGEKPIVYETFHIRPKEIRR